MILAEARICILHQRTYEKDLSNFSLVVESFTLLRCLMEVSWEGSTACTGQCALEMLDAVVRLLFHR